MEANFQRALALVLKHEGGFADHPSDPGGATNKGITLETFQQYVKHNGTVADLKRITDAQVATVYKLHYWNKVKGDDLPAGVDYAVFDFAVNSGPKRAAEYLQSLLLVKVDGIIGPQTIAAAKRADAGQLINALCDKRMTFLKGLPTWGDFGKGWTRRVSDVRIHALAMAMDGHTAPSPYPEPQTPAEPKPAPLGKGGAIVALFAALAAAAYAAWDHITAFFGGLF